LQQTLFLTGRATAKAWRMVALSYYRTNLFYLVDATSSALRIGSLKDVAGNLIIYRGRYLMEDVAGNA